MDDIATDIVTQYSLSGHPPQSTDCIVPCIPDDFLDCSIYLYASRIDAESGAKTGGSGFLMSLPVRRLDRGHFRIAVTNRHVVEQGFTIIRLNTKDGSTDVVEKTERDWIWPEDGTDLAVTTVHIKDEIHRFSLMPYHGMVTSESFEKQNIGIGDDLFLVGRFIGHDGQQTNIPTVRFGHIAQWPTRPLIDEYGRSQESFLAEVRSIGGFSGSPVFVYIPPMAIRPERAGQLSTQYFGPALIGVDWCHTTMREPLRDGSGLEMPNSVHVRANTGLMGVIPCWKLDELLNSDQLWERLDLVEQKIIDRQQDPVESDVIVEPGAETQTPPLELFEGVFRHGKNR